MKMKSVVLIIFLLATTASGFVYLKSSTSSDNSPVLYGDVLLGSNEADKGMPLRFMVRGEQIFLDENGDQIPQASELLPDRKIEQISNSQLESNYTISKLDLGVAPESVSESLTQKLIVYVDIGQGEDQYSMSGKMELTSNPEQANWLHFGGPLSFMAMETLEVSKKANGSKELTIFLGTIANGPNPLVDGAQQDVDVELNPVFRTTVVTPSDKPPYPQASVAFQIPNTEPFVQELTMDQFC